jgi:hypothetical protein
VVATFPSIAPQGLIPNKITERLSANQRFGYFSVFEENFLGSYVPFPPSNLHMKSFRRAGKKPDVRVGVNPKKTKSNNTKILRL